MSKTQSKPYDIHTLASELVAACELAEVAMGLRGAAACTPYEVDEVRRVLRAAICRARGEQP